ncbi:MAG: ribosome biogenesis GTPase YlqF [Clostridia bacterium]|jgi:ribosome biogenesis GTPase A|nr:ribosome biogenesis GTPase YlqF [Clostridia bacterium]
MDIQWFPGHMTKALRMMENELKVIDAAVYVLDSRAPMSCINPEFAKLIKNKPIIYALNKADLVETTEVKAWAKHFTTSNSSAVIINSTMTNSSAEIIKATKLLLKEKIERYARKNIAMPIRLMIIGVPNSGKSTLINNLCGKYKAITGNRPGVTKGKQWITLPSGIEVLDTPGTLWPSFENKNVAKNLAYIGSIKDEVLDIYELALTFIEDFKSKNVFQNRYGVKELLEKTPLEILCEICFARGFILKGNEPDFVRGSNAIIDDFRKGRMGKIMLEKFSDFNF